MGCRPVERSLIGWRLRVAYPLGGSLPPLRYVPAPVRRVTRRRLTELCVRLNLARCSDLRIVGVTGSMGKTTTKDLLGAMLATRGPTVVTRKNDNGLYGLPHTLLGLRPTDRFAVVEAGINGPGEMEWMARLFRPEVAILTGIGVNHTTTVGTPDDIAREKRSLLLRVAPEGVAIVDADDPRTLAAAADLDCRVVTVGRAATADVRIVDVRLDWPNGIAVVLEHEGETHRIATQLLAPHFAHPLGFAFAAACALGVPARLAVAAAAVVPPRVGRLSPSAGPGGSLLISDDHASRLPSALAALRTLGELPARRRIAVLGDVQDPRSHPDVHGALGRAAAQVADVVVGVGEVEPILAAVDGGAEVHRAARPSDAARLLAPMLGTGDVVLIHGASRQHLMRVTMRLRGEHVGCDVARCVIQWRCEDCPHLPGQPPAAIVEAV